MENFRESVFAWKAAGSRGAVRGIIFKIKDSFGRQKFSEAFY